ncbi:M15 family metallopeptidase [Vulcanococcus limneticus]|uniref:M15 family metallopeptidase n=1 Tax=Vulcanococcus limneticus TaxID=2170428 RepID=UPI00398BCE1F
MTLLTFTTAGSTAPVSASVAAAGGLRCSGIALLPLLALEPRSLFELRYVSPYNFLGASLYHALDGRLRCPVGLALQQVQLDLAAEGLGLNIWDSYRPLAVQQRMWDEIRDPRYASDPAVNSGRHTRGTAVDVILVDRRGMEMPMPTDFDDFSEAAHVDAAGVPTERRCFRSFATEWWHFDRKDWQTLPVVTGISPN